MANNRFQRLMQESLDEALSSEHVTELRRELSRDARQAKEYEKLKRVHQLLSNAPHERAPERLALSIMARIAQSVSEEAKAQEELSPETEQALMLSLTLVFLIAMPALLAASWLVVNAISSPDVLTNVIHQILALLAAILEALQTLLDACETLIHDNPEAVGAALALIPVVLLGLLDYLQGESDEQ